jgi:uncharacterized protein YfaS (alpha-2-macroglobulin family)
LDRRATLRIATGLNLTDFLLAWAKEPLVLTFPDQAPRMFNVNLKLDNKTLYPQVLSQGQKLSLTIPPLKGHIKGRVFSGEIHLEVEFNRSMVKFPEERRSYKPLNEPSQDLPLRITPQNGDLKGDYLWRNPQILSIRYFVGQDSYQDDVIDKKFDILFNDAFTALSGEKVSSLKGRLEAYVTSGLALLGSNPSEWVALKDDTVYLDRFRLVGLTQEGFTDQGQTRLGLAFNKKIDLNDLGAALNLKLLTPGGKTETFVPLDYQLESLDPSGLTAKILVRVKDEAVIDAIVRNLTDVNRAGLIAEATSRVRIHNQLHFYQARLGRYPTFPWDPYFDIRIRESFAEDNPTPFIRLEPPLPFKAELVEGNGVIRITAPFNRERPTKVILLPGLRSIEGILTEEVTYVAEVPKDELSKLIFTGEGRFLSPKKDLLVKVAGRDMEFIRVQAWRLYEDTLPALLSLSAIVSGSTKAQLGLRLAKNVIDFEVPLGPDGRLSFERLLDLGDLLKPAKGAYVLKITPIVRSKDGSKVSYESGRLWGAYEEEYFNDYSYSAEPERYLPVMITDLGLSVRVLKGQIQVWVTSLSEATGVKGATVKFFDPAGQIVHQGVSGADGLFTANVNDSEVFGLTVQKGDDLTYALISKEVVNVQSAWFDGKVSDLIQDRGSGRSYLTQGYEGFLILPRDLWKPGETLAVKGFIRDKNGLPPKASFPLTWRILDREERAVDEGQATVSLNGALDFTATTPYSVRTGPGAVEVAIPGQEVLARRDITFDDFVPPRLELSLASTAEYQGDDPTFTLTGSAKYLYGSKGSGLAWEMRVFGSPGMVTIPGFEGFDFSGPLLSYSAEKLLETDGALDEDGLLDLTIQAHHSSITLPNLVDLTFNWRVQNEAGRFEGRSATAKWFPRPVLLGLKAPKTLAIGEESLYQLAAVTSALEPLDLNLLVTISKVKDIYYTEVRYGQLHRQSGEELVPVATMEVALKDGLGQAPFTPEVGGLYQITVSSPDRPEVYGRRFRVMGDLGQEESPPEDLINLSLNKEFYRPGEEATVTVTSPFKGLLLLNLETDSLIWSKTVKVTELTQTVKVPVPKGLVNNAQLTASLIRPLEKEATVFLAQGRVSLENDRAPYRLNIAVTEPELIRPSSKVPLKINLTDDNGRPASGEVTVALVDEGILSLNGYRIPNPGPFFWSSRSLISHYYDTRAALLPLEERIWPFLAPGGGEALEGYFSPYQRRLELLTVFLATLAIGPNGQGEALIDLPEYSGQGRLTVVAANGLKFGYLEKRLLIARPVTVEPSAPLALAPGDVFNAPIRVFMSPEAGGGRVTLELAFKGPIRLLEAPDWDNGRVTLELNPGETRSLTVKLEAVLPNGQKEGGPAEILVNGSYAGETFTQAATTVVRPPYPRVTESSVLAVQDEVSVIKAPYEKFLTGTVNASLSIAAGPWASANRAVDYLNSYPYGCLEQTVSKAFRFLAEPDLGRLSPKDAALAIVGLKEAVKRLASAQTFQGGFGYWPNDSSVYEWGSVYAAHFLTAAKERVDLPSGLLEGALGYLKNFIAADYGSANDYDARYRLSVKAYAVFVLALNGEFQTGWLNSLEERSLGLTPSAQIFLAAAQSLRAGNSEPLVALEKKGLKLDAPESSHYRSSLESLARNEALLLLAWASVDPLATRSQELAAQVAKRGTEGRWSTTQENGQALWALANYLKRSKTISPYEAVLTDAKGTVLGQGTNEDLSTISGPDLIAALANPLTLTVKGEGRPWRSLVVSGVPLAAPAPVAKGITLTKTWRVKRLNDLLGPKIDLTESQAEPIRLQRGQRIAVTLRLTAPEPVANVVIADLLPGGLEFDNLGLDEDQERLARAEIREDRLILVIPRLEGETTFTFTVRAVTTGEFVLPPTVAEGMYEPDKTAILPEGRVIIEETSPESEE